MTPEERDLIEGVFERMRSVGAIDKDREAEALINTSVRQIRDSAYMLVQTVDRPGPGAASSPSSGCRSSSSMVADLEAQLQQQQQPQQRSSGGGFLGGIFGGGAKPAPCRARGFALGRQRAVGRPAVGRLCADRQQSASPWNSAPPEPRAGGYHQQPMQQQPAAAGGGGFMRSALTTAAGVAGGVLVAGAIGNMMRGDSGSHGEGGSTWSSGDGNASSSGYQDASSNDQGGTYSVEPQYQDAGRNDQGTYAEPPTMRHRRRRRQRLGRRRYRRLIPVTLTSDTECGQASAALRVCALASVPSAR